MRSTLVRAASLLLPAVTAACSGNAATYTSDADRGSTHALVTIERRVLAGTVEPAQSRAFATFVRTPPEVDPTLVTRLAGVGAELPEIGHCALPGQHREGSSPLAPLRRVELLDAGDVALETDTGGRVELAPRAFPAVTSLFAGVVYTTRDRIAALPEDSRYAVVANGGALDAPLSMSAVAPAMLTGATVDSVALDSGATLNPAGSELAWTPGSSRDLVYAVISDAAGEHRVTCAFRDDAGRAVLPPSAIPPASAASLSLHRLRVVPITASPESGVDAGELRFDFELSATLAVGAR